MAKKETRFLVTKIQSNTYIWVDKQTGVNYLYVQVGYGGGLTPLLNRDGTPVITAVPKDIA